MIAEHDFRTRGYLAQDVSYCFGSSRQTGTKSYSEILHSLCSCSHLIWTNFLFPYLLWRCYKVPSSLVRRSYIPGINLTSKDSVKNVLVTLNRFSSEILRAVCVSSRVGVFFRQMLRILKYMLSLYCKFL
jgi:hypothetical protein